MRRFLSIANTCLPSTRVPLNHIYTVFRDSARIFSTSTTTGPLPVTCVPMTFGRKKRVTNCAWARCCTVSLSAIYWPCSRRHARQCVATNATMDSVIRGVTNRSASSMATSVHRPRAAGHLFLMRLILPVHFSTIEWAMHIAGVQSTFRC